MKLKKNQEDISCWQENYMNYINLWIHRESTPVEGIFTCSFKITSPCEALFVFSVKRGGREWGKEDLFLDLNFKMKCPSKSRLEYISGNFSLTSFYRFFFKKNRIYRIKLIWPYCFTVDMFPKISTNHFWCYQFYQVYHWSFKLISSIYNKTLSFQ